MRQPFGVDSEMAGSGGCDGRRSKPRFSLRRTLRRIIDGFEESPAFAVRRPAAPADIVARDRECERCGG